jgi:SAM-dependent methyltransferase
MENSPAGAPNPALVFETLQAHQRTAALRAAIELDLFRALGPAPVSAAAIAEACQASERGIRILCDFLTIVGILAKQDGGYKHTPSSAAFLDPRSPMCMAATARFLGLPAMQEPYNHLADIVRSGRTSMPGEGSVAPENPVWVEFAHSMAPMMAPMSKPLGAIVLDGLHGPIRVLDIAAGHGLFGIEVGKQNKEAIVQALDWASVLAVAQANAQAAGIGDRYQTLPGSAFDVPFAGPYNLVLLTNFLHHYDPPTNTELLRKVYAALHPGGRVAILEFVPNDDRISPPGPAAFALTMLASTASGDAYPFSALQSMLDAAGFENVTMQPVPMGPHTVVMANRGSA